MTEPHTEDSQALACALTLSGGAQGVFRFEAGTLLEFGRARECGVPIDDHFASRRHCRVGLVPGEGLVLRDLRSANGTLLNGARVERAVLRSGDLIEIGAVELRVRIDAGTLPRTGTLGERAPEPAAAPGVDVPRALAQEGYALTHVLAERGAVTVYRGTRVELDQPVVLKVMRLDASLSVKERARFIDGAQAQASLHHRNVATVYDVRQAEGILFVVTEAVSGETLAAKLERGTRRLAVKDALRIGYQIASALAHLTEHNVVHRDVRPDTIMITPEGDALLGDFDLAKTVAGEQAFHATGFGESLGTPGYMAPEQIKAAGYADARADIYGLGATLYHCLSGRAAVPGAQPRSGLAPLAEIPRIVVGLVMRMVQPQAEDRFQSPTILMRAIEAVTTQLTGITADAGNVDVLLRLPDEHESDLFLTPFRGHKRPPASFQGIIQDMALVEFLQMLEFNGKSGTLLVTEGAFSLSLRVRDGSVLGVEPDVLHRALDLEGGAFTFDAHLVPAPRLGEPSVKIGQLLLDHLRAADEQRR